MPATFLMIKCPGCIRPDARVSTLGAILSHAAWMPNGSRGGTCPASHRVVVPGRKHRMCVTCTCPPLVKIRCAWCDYEVAVLARSGQVSRHAARGRLCEGYARSVDEHRSHKQAILNVEIAVLDASLRKRPTRKVAL